MQIGRSFCAFRLEYIEKGREAVDELRLPALSSELKKSSIPFVIRSE